MEACTAPSEIGQEPNGVVLRSERKKEILEILRRNEMTAREIAEALNMDLKAVYHHALGWWRGRVGGIKR